MGLFQNIKNLTIKKSFDQTGWKIISGSEPETLNQNLGEWNAALLNYFEGAVYANITSIASAINNAEWKVYRGDTEIKHWVADLLARPNERVSQNDMFDFLTTNLLLSGNAFVYFVLNTRGIPVELKNMPLSTITLVKDRNNVVTGYGIKQENGTIAPLDPKEIIHFKMSPLISNFTGFESGYSPLLAVGTYVTSAKELAYLQSYYLKNRNTPEGVLRVDMSAEAFTNFKKGWKDKQEGVKNAGKMAMINSSSKDAVSFEKISSGLESLDLTKQFEPIDKKIDEAFGVNPYVKGNPQDQNRATSENAMEVFYSQTVNPLLDKIKDALNKWLYLYDKTLELRYELPTIQSAEKDLANSTVEKTKAETVQILISAGFAPNDALKYVGIETPITYIGTQVAETPKAITVNNFIENKKDLTPLVPVEEEEYTGDLVTVQKNIETDLLEEYVTRYKSALKKLNKEQLEQVLKSLRENADNFENIQLPDLQTELDKYITGISETAVAVYVVAKSKILNQAKKEAVNFILNSDDFSGDYLLQTKQQIQNIKAGALKDGSKFVREQSGNSITKYLQETNENMRKLIKASQEAGITAPKLADELAKLTNNETNGWRAKRIAQTEIHQYNQKAGVDVMNQISTQTGLQVVKTFQCQPDCCEFCSALDGKTYPVKEVIFAKGQTIKGIDGGERTNDYMDFEGASIHPNCQCSLVFTYKD